MRRSFALMLAVLAIVSGLALDAPAPPAGAQTASPPGRFTFVDQSDESVWSADAAGNDRRLVLPPTDTSNSRGGAVLSPGGTQLAYSSFVKPNNTMTHLFVTAVGSGATTDIGPMVAGGKADWSPDGTRLAYLEWADWWTGSSVLVVASAGGGQIRRLIPASGGASWSPDNRYLATTSLDHESVLVFDLQTSSTRVVRREVHQFGNVQWSPDGSRIAAVQNVYGRRRLVTMHPDGSGMQVLREFEAPSSLGLTISWRPDSQAMLIGTDSRPIEIVDVSGKTLAAPPGTEFAYQPRFSRLGSEPSGCLGAGYWVAATNGRVLPFGTAPWFGEAAWFRPNDMIMDIEPTASGKGYWQLERDGTVYWFGDARFHGEARNTGMPIMDMTATPSGNGYWLIALDGTVHAFGDAAHLGDARGRGTWAMDLAATPTGNGYWIALANGTIVGVGDASAFQAPYAPGNPTVAIDAATTGAWTTTWGAHPTSGAGAPTLGTSRLVEPSWYWDFAVHANGPGFWALRPNGEIAALGGAPWCGSPYSTNAGTLNLAIAAAP